MEEKKYETNQASQSYDILDTESIWDQIDDLGEIHLDEDDFLDVFHEGYERLDFLKVQEIAKGDYQEYKTPNPETDALVGVIEENEEYIQEAGDKPYELRIIEETTPKSTYMEMEDDFEDLIEQQIEQTKAEEEEEIKPQAQETELEIPELEEKKEIEEQINHSIKENKITPETRIEQQPEQTETSEQKAEQQEPQPEIEIVPRNESLLKQLLRKIFEF